MKASILKALLKHKESPCVSVIMTTDSTSFSSHEEIALKLKNAIKEAKQTLHENYDDSTVKELTDSLTSLATRAGIHHLRKGVGLFVSPGFAQMVNFSFPVGNKVIVGDTFEVRDVIANLNLLIPYRVLVLSKGACRLFKGNGIDLTEVKDEKFPMQYEEEFQLEKSHPGSFYNGEESKVNQARVEEYFRKVDNNLAGYSENQPLILLGVDKLLSTFKKVSNQVSLIIGDITGNYDKQSVQEISSMAWPVMKAYHDGEQAKVLELAKNAIYEGKAVSGIQEVWDVARQGIGSTLIVEKDYACKAFVGNEYNELVLDNGGQSDYREVPDVVEAVIDLLTDQHETHISIVNNDVLKDHGRIILTTRY